MKAIILAGGKGTRLSPLTDNIPKVLVPIKGKPMLEYIRDWLGSYEFIDDVVIKSGYMSDKIIQHVGCLPFRKHCTSIIKEKGFLGTAGAIKELSNDIDGTFIVVYGDILTNLNLKLMLGFHKSHKSSFTIAITESDRQDAGKIKVNQDRVTGLFEKDASVQSNLINMGVYIIEKQVLDYIPTGVSDFAINVIPSLICENQYVFGYMFDGYYKDIGTIERYREAEKDVESGIFTV